MNETDDNTSLPAAPAPAPTATPAPQAGAAAKAPDSAAPAPGSLAAKPRRKKAARSIHPLLHTLFELYPGLFGMRFLPLKLGVFEELVAAHPDRLPADELKVALGLHTRSNRYLEAVASGLPRHDLQGRPLEPIAPEHVHHAIIELYRRKSTTPQEPAARQRAIAQLVQAIDRSGLGRDGYRERFGAAPEPARGLLEEALMALGQKSARVEALRRAFAASGKTAQEFAEMYGLGAAEVEQLDASSSPAAGGSDGTSA